MAKDIPNPSDWYRPGGGGYRCPNCSSMRVEAEAYDGGYQPDLKLVCQNCDAEVWA